MGSNKMTDGNIYFLDYIFNRKTRTLQKNGVVSRLRKKQSDVLALLCDKYPNPVSLQEFLDEVWEGGYVTPQSIAQVIRSLRLSLNDTKKIIIITVPKLGYHINVVPTYQPPNKKALEIEEPKKIGKKDELNIKCTYKAWPGDYVAQYKYIMKRFKFLKGFHEARRLSHLKKVMFCSIGALSLVSLFYIMLAESIYNNSFF